MPKLASLAGAGVAGSATSSAARMRCTCIKARLCTPRRLAEESGKKSAARSSGARLTGEPRNGPLRARLRLGRAPRVGRVQWARHAARAAQVSAPRPRWALRDAVLLDVFPGILFVLEPCRHPPTT